MMTYTDVSGRHNDGGGSCGHLPGTTSGLVGVCLLFMHSLIVSGRHDDGGGSVLMGICLAPQVDSVAYVFYS